MKQMMRKLKKYKPTKLMAKDSRYNKDAADFAVMFIESLCHTKGTWAGQPFELIDWQEQIIRDLFGILKPNGYRQFNTAYISNKGVSLLENAAHLGLPIPEKLKDVLEQLHDRAEKDEGKKE